MHRAEYIPDVDSFVSFLSMFGAKPAEDISHPAEGISNPAKEITDPSKEMADPAEEMTKAAEELSDLAKNISDRERIMSELRQFLADHRKSLRMQALLATGECCSPLSYIAPKAPSNKQSKIKDHV